MKLKIFYILLLFFSTIANAFANNNIRYQHIHFSIINQTNYPIALRIVYTHGIWEKAVALNMPMLINANDHYDNTLTSINENNDWSSFASMQAAQIGNERENNVIFAENGSSQKQVISEHFFDGLGKIFVGSVTNHCNDTTLEGYSNCVIIVKE